MCYQYNRRSTRAGLASGLHHALFTPLSAKRGIFAGLFHYICKQLTICYSQRNLEDLEFVINVEWRKHDSTLTWWSTFQNVSKITLCLLNAEGRKMGVVQLSQCTMTLSVCIKTWLALHILPNKELDLDVQVWIPFQNFTTEPDWNNVWFNIFKWLELFCAAVTHLFEICNCCCVQLIDIENKLSPIFPLALDL